MTTCNNPHKNLEIETTKTPVTIDQNWRTGWDRRLLLGWAQLCHRSEERERGQLGFEQERRHLGAFNLAGSPLEQIQTAKDQKQEAKMKSVATDTLHGRTKPAGGGEEKMNRRPAHFCCSWAGFSSKKNREEKNSSGKKIMMIKLSQTEEATEPRQSLVESSMPVCWFAWPQICSRRTKIEMILGQRSA
jgi:hypothetical protein